VTLSEITIESFFPADAPTAERLSKYIGAAADEGHERVPPPPADFD
jgi:hypothetical protein